MRIRSLASAALALAAVACTGEKLSHVPAPGTRTDVFNQASASKLDLLWVIDNSGSMADKQAKLAASFQRFIDVFARGAVDYRIAVTTTDTLSRNTPGAQGTFFNVNGSPQVITPQDPDPLTEFQQNVKVGITGTGNEEGLGASRMALDRILNDPGYQAALSARQGCLADCAANHAKDPACTPGCESASPVLFLRPDAYLYVIFVSDEDDKSGSEPLFYGRYLETVKGLGNEVAVSASAIVGNPAGDACDAAPGRRYATVAGLTGGIIASVCDANFDQGLAALAQNAVGLKRHYLLRAQPQKDTLDVKILYRCDSPPLDLAYCASVDDGCAGASPDTLGLTCHPRQAQEVAVDADHPEGFTAGVSYQCSDNSLYFHRDATADAVPGLRSQVQATYLPAAKGAACGG